MLVQMNCRGYAIANHLQPEPAKYAHAPLLEATTFMQPEQAYFAHHPGRFFYIKDEESGDFFSAPYEPTRKPLDAFVFSAGENDLSWRINALGLEVNIQLSLTQNDIAEFWAFSIRNTGSTQRKISIYPYFPFGYISWMNLSAAYDAELGGIIAKGITPYQKLEEYEKIKNSKHLSYFIHEHPPTSWEANQYHFEGEGGLHNPSGMQKNRLEKGQAMYEIPAAVLQYSCALKTEQIFSTRFIFGPAKKHEDIAQLREKYFPSTNSGNSLHEDPLNKNILEYQSFIRTQTKVLKIETPDPHFDNFVNSQLAKQVYYHGDVNRLSTDPQTRNFLQDTMGLSYFSAPRAREAFITALSQQHFDGAMPDGILLHKDATLKYINQVPHTDHCVWLPICLQAYLDESNDYALLDVHLAYSNNTQEDTVYTHIHKAMQWLLSNRDERGLAYIAQGDWCDPMNMVGHKGKGVSAWLTQAISYSLKIWADIIQSTSHSNECAPLNKHARNINADINQHFWNGEWYSRGITDDNVAFGIPEDKEGRIYLNPQSWAMLCGACDSPTTLKLLNEIDAHLLTPYGVMMLAPAYTVMREDIGRLTQKQAGYAENASVYNHAESFYIYALYQHGFADRAFDLMRKMIPGPDDTDYQTRGQLPLFIPNYYRGAYYQHPETAGRSSQLFNTGSCHWYFRSLIDGLFGVRGTREGLSLSPQLPSHWPKARLSRVFRHATFVIDIERKDIDDMPIWVDEVLLSGCVIKNIQAGKHYQVIIHIPKSSALK